MHWHLINVNNFLGKKNIKYGWGAYIGKSSYAGLFKKEKKSLGYCREFIQRYQCLEKKEKL